MSARPSFWSSTTLGSVDVSDPGSAAALGNVSAGASTESADRGRDARDSSASIASTIAWPVGFRFPVQRCISRKRGSASTAWSSANARAEEPSVHEAALDPLRQLGPDLLLAGAEECAEEAHRRRIAA